VLFQLGALRDARISPAYFWPECVYRRGSYAGVGYPSSGQALGQPFSLSLYKGAVWCYNEGDIHE